MAIVTKSSHFSRVKAATIIGMVNTAPKQKACELPESVRDQAILLVAEVIAKTGNASCSVSAAKAKLQDYLAGLMLTNQIPPMDTAKLNWQVNALTAQGEMEAARREAMAEALRIGIKIQAAMDGVSGASDWIFGMGKQKPCAMLNLF
jgi:hypothetical protein